MPTKQALIYKTTSPGPLLCLGCWLSWPLLSPSAGRLAPLPSGYSNPPITPFQYANFTVQNTRLEAIELSRLREASVSVILNASLLEMRLVRQQEFSLKIKMTCIYPHPELRDAIKAASDCCECSKVVCIMRQARASVLNRL